MGERKPTYGRKTGARRAAATHELGFHWGPRNWALLGAGVVAIGLGFLTLAQGSLTLAPVLLVVGYCVLVPASLLLRAESGTSGE